MFNTIKTPQSTSDVTDEQNTVRVKSDVTRPSISAASHLLRGQEMSPNSTIINRNNDSVSYSVLTFEFLVLISFFFQFLNIVLFFSFL